MKKSNNLKQHGFTIVELLIVIVIIGILASITVVVYSGITGRAGIAAMKSELKSAASVLSVDRFNDGSYPGSLEEANNGQGITAGGDRNFSYTGGGDSFCLSVTSSQIPSESFYITESGVVQEGDCTPAGPVANGDFIQTVTAANCPTDRTWVVDARDSKTYWVQKLDDDNCWMLTNLAYGGGGTNTYGDTKTLAHATSGNVYDEPRYFVHDNASPTTAPTPPSTSTNGSGQYGYLYNWCAAMGAQLATSACADWTDTEADPPSTNISVCPANWRLPTGGGSGEFAAMNTAVNGGLTNTDAGLLTTWLGQRGGGWLDGFISQGSSGFYWSSTEGANSNNALRFQFSSSSVNLTGNSSRSVGVSVRCVAT